jgi:hypothetical protein
MKLVVLMLAIASISNADTITVSRSAICNAVIGVENCQDGATVGENGFSYDLSEFALSASAAAGARAYRPEEEPSEENGWGSVPREEAEASAGVSVSFRLRTFGQLRSGIIQITGRETFEGSGGEGGTFSLNATRIIELGTLFRGPGVSARAYSYFDGQGSFVTASSESMQLRVYEADGTTPVRIYWSDQADPAAIPEPSTISLSLAAMIVLGFVRR